MSNAWKEEILQKLESAKTALMTAENPSECEELMDELFAEYDDHLTAYYDDKDSNSDEPITEADVVDL